MQTVSTVVIAVVLHLLGGLALWGVAHGDYGNPVILLLPIIAIGTLFSPSNPAWLTMTVGTLGAISTTIMIVQATRSECGIVRLVGDIPSER